MRVLVDMDGVLCDYYAGIVKAFTSDFEPWPYRCKFGEWNFFVGEPMNLTNDQAAPVMDCKFYENLDWLPDGRLLIERVEQIVGAQNVFVMTSPWDTPGCDQGKRNWIDKHLPKYRRRTMIGTPKEIGASAGSVLLDDSRDNCFKFAEAGGHAILVPRPWNSRHKESDSFTGKVLDLEGSALGRLVKLAERFDSPEAQTQQKLLRNWIAAAC